MKRIDNFFFFCGLSMLFSEIWKQCCLTFFINGSSYDWWYFPFQLCSVPMYLTLLYPWIKSSKAKLILHTFLMDFALLGGIFAFFDTSGMQYPIPALTIHSYLWHILLIFLGITAGFTQPGKSLFSGAAVLYGLGCVIATFLNLCFHSFGTLNLFYINPYLPMQQPVFRWFARYLGNPAGICCYMGASVFGAWLIHQIWRQISNIQNSSAPFPP